jgi:hypothetical protein
MPYVVNWRLCKYLFMNVFVCVFERVCVYVYACVSLRELVEGVVEVTGVRFI